MSQDEAGGMAQPLAKTQKAIQPSVVLDVAAEQIESSGSSFDKVLQTMVSVHHPWLTRGLLLEHMAARRLEPEESEAIQEDEAEELAESEARRIETATTSKDDTEEKTENQNAAEEAERTTTTTKDTNVNTEEGQNDDLSGMEDVNVNTNTEEGRDGNLSDVNMRDNVVDLEDAAADESERHESDEEEVSSTESLEQKPPKRQKNTFEDRLEQLKAHYAENGNFYVPRSNRGLYNWASRVRQEYYRQTEPNNKKRKRQIILTKERIELLDKVGFPRDAVLKQNNRSFEEHLKQLAEFKREHGHCNVPRQYTKLKSFVKRMRKNYHDFQQKEKPTNSSFTQENIDALEALGFQWVVREMHWQVKPFETRLQELKEHIENNEIGARVSGGKPRPLQVVDVTDKSLRRWLNHQRDEYSRMKKGLSSVMTEEKVAALEELGFIWDGNKARYETLFEACLEELRQYKQTHGHLCMPDRNKCEPKYRPLAGFVKDVRRKFRLKMEGKPTPLTGQQIQALTDVGLLLDIPDGYDTSFEDSLEELRHYKQSHGHLCMPGRDECNPKYRHLVDFVNGMLKKYSLKKAGRETSITHYQMLALEEVGLRLKNPEQTKIDKMVVDFCKFKSANSHLNHDEKYPEFGKTVKMLHSSFELYQKGQKSDLTFGHIEQLNAVGFSI